MINRQIGKNSSVDKNKSDIVIGIDLGTTNSVMAVAGLTEKDQFLNAPLDSEKDQGSFPHFIPVELLQLPQLFLDGTEASSILFPSVVFQEDQGAPIIAGMGAKEAKYHYRRGRKIFYSVKMDLGVKKLYPSAISESLNSPVKVSSHILKEMRRSGESVIQKSFEDIPVVITIPASFEAPQRKDTLEAARNAGFDVDFGCLMDEPNAALLAYLNRQRIQLRWNQEETVLVFDFGGGTCDISIIDVSYSPVRKAITLKNIAISRFEKLGGDDIDNHLVHKYLKEQFYEVSGYEEKEWSYAERQYRIWSQLSKIAELLKIRFSEELEAVSQMTTWDMEKLKDISISIPPQTVNTSRGDIVMPDLWLNWETFNDLLQPFIDPTCSQNENREYYTITSIFSPIKDALNKSGLEKNNITRILLVGGSSLNPVIERKLQDYFKEANIERPEDMDFLVAEGAAVHAYTRHVLGHDILAPIIGDSIGILTERGEYVPLIPAGAAIPFPDESNFISYEQFNVPKNSMSHVDLIFCAGNANRPVHTVKLNFNRSVPKGTPVYINIRLDENKILGVKAFLLDYPDIEVKEIIDNPLGLLPMTSKERARVELESDLCKARINGTISEHIEDAEEYAKILYELDHCEKALEWINFVIKDKERATYSQKMLKAQIHFRLGEMEEAHNLFSELSIFNASDIFAALYAGLTAQTLDKREFFMRRAVQAAPKDGICHFFLADTLKLRGKYDEAQIVFRKSQELLEIQAEHEPWNRNLVYYLGLVYQSLGEKEKALLMEKKYHSMKEVRRSTGFDTSSAVALANKLTEST
jgi:molecular chaperone DnaK (HSP70)